MNNPLNSGNTQTDNAAGNPELSPLMGKSQETIPEGSRPKRAEAGGALLSNVKGDDIVQSMSKDIAVKQCKICGAEKEVKYFPSKGRICKACCSEISTAYQKTEKGKEVHKRANAKYNRTHRKAKLNGNKAYKASLKGKESEKRYYKSMVERHPERVRARNRINYLVYVGKLIKPSECSECGVSCILEAHHMDYSKPEEIIWLCNECHCLTHTE